MAVVLCAMCLLLSACAGKKTHEADSVRSIVVNLAAKQAADPDVPGLSVAVLRRGQDTPITAAFGNASLENPTPVTTASLFKIGSVTKVFTATLIHRLIEEGKLSYDTPISQFFPLIPTAKPLPCVICWSTHRAYLKCSPCPQCSRIWPATGRQKT